jgi:hypothetical protein
MSENERCELLSNYISTEPEIMVNAERYLVSVDNGRTDAVYFYAVTKYGELGAMVGLHRGCWEDIACGLAMAYAYNTVLERLESSLKLNGGRS